MRRLALLPILLVAAASASGLARPRPVAAEPAPDASAEIKALVAELDAGISEKDEGKITAAAKKAPSLYKGTEDTALRASLLKALGSAVKQTKVPVGARRAALTAVVETEDPKEAYKAIQSAYPKDDVEDPDKFNLDVVRSIGLLKPDSAIPALLETYKKAKPAELAAEAVAALGNYHTSKQREKILEEIYKIGKNLVPARSSSKNASPETIARWGVVGPAIGKALDALTGDSVGEPTEWFKRIGDTKSVKSLFKT